MEKSFNKALEGYQNFRKKYASDDQSVMQYLSYNGQQPKIMIVACCDSRVDPALILQCEPGDLFVVRNVANIVPPYEKDEAHHGTSAALEFGICGLQVKHLILLGHSQCGGIAALMDSDKADKNDFISNWVSLIKPHEFMSQDQDEYAKLGLDQSYQNCLTFPWIKEKVEEKKLKIHLWFFDIKTGRIFTHSETEKEYQPLEVGD
jgi:carbonic anhydrase